eukprot:11177739-Lingulodinium_polyedra.AAC.1
MPTSCGPTSCRNHQWRGGDPGLTVLVIFPVDELRTRGLDPAERFQLPAVWLGPARPDGLE